MSKAGASLATCYGPVSADVIAKAENIRLLILDVDGVLSDGLSIAVADAHPLLLPRADYVTKIAGGRGAVREVCDLLLLAQGKLDEAKGQSI